jgi:hypothetical protein
MPKGFRATSRNLTYLCWVLPWMSRAESEAMPARIAVRELRIRVRDRTKRVRDLVIATTLADGASYPAEELRSLFRHRWHAELYLHTLKTEMHREMVQTKTPAMMRTEVAIHLLASNLIRGIMAEAARIGEVSPRTLSFTGALPTVRSFEEGHLYAPTRLAADLPRLLELVVRSV